MVAALSPCPVCKTACASAALAGNHPRVPFVMCMYLEQTGATVTPLLGMCAHPCSVCCSLPGPD